METMKHLDSFENMAQLFWHFTYLTCNHLSENYWNPCAHPTQIQRQVGNKANKKVRERDTRNFVGKENDHRGISVAV